MRVAAGADPTDVRGQGDVAGNALPYVMKGVGGEPHVFAATRDLVSPAGGVEFHGAGSANHSDVSVAFKQSKVGRSELSQQARVRQNETQDGQDQSRRAMHEPIKLHRVPCHSPVGSGSQDGTATRKMRRWMINHEIRGQPDSSSVVRLWNASVDLLLALMAIALIISNQMAPITRPLAAAADLGVALAIFPFILAPTES